MKQGYMHVIPSLEEVHLDEAFTVEEIIGFIKLELGGESPFIFDPENFFSKSELVIYTYLRDKMLTAINSIAESN